MPSALEAFSFAKSSYGSLIPDKRRKELRRDSRRIKNAFSIGGILICGILKNGIFQIEGKMPVNHPNPKGKMCD
jgi:hypothetical protein